MGNSATGRHADGVAIYGPESAWPDGLRRVWAPLVDAITGSVGPATLPGRTGPTEPPGGPRRLLSALRDPATAGAMVRLARRHGVDEAEVALLWAGTAVHAGQSTARVVRRQLALVRAVESRIVTEWKRLAGPSARRLSTAARLAIRTNLVDAIGCLPDGQLPVKGRTQAWLRSDDARRLLERLLPGAVPPKRPR